MRYDHPNSIIRREHRETTAAGNAAVSTRFVAFQKARLKSIQARIVVAGTSAGAGASLVFRHGTTVLGTMTLGTSTVGSLLSLQNLNRDLASMDIVDGTNGTDASARAVVVYEHEMQWDGTQTL